MVITTAAVPIPRTQLTRQNSLFESPVLNRVERAEMRLEADNNNRSRSRLDNNCSMERSNNKQMFLPRRIPPSLMADTGPIKRGLLWQQRDRLFSRWKERYFLLTRDYLHCFKKASGSANDRMSDMGQFLFKINLVDIEKVEWINRRSYSVIGLRLLKNGRIFLRTESGLEDWCELLDECILISKERRRVLLTSQLPGSRASLAIPFSHGSLHAFNFGLGTFGDRSTNNNNSIKKFNGNLSSAWDSVPDLTTSNKENQYGGYSTNQSTPQRFSYSNLNSSRNSYGYWSHNSSLSSNNQNYSSSPRRICINNSFGSHHIVNEEEEVELRNSNILYMKPKAPFQHSSKRRSVQITDLDEDSGVDTPPSTTRRQPSIRDNNSSISRTPNGSPGGSLRTSLQRQSIQDRSIARLKTNGSYAIENNLQHRTSSINSINRIGNTYNDIQGLEKTRGLNGSAIFRERYYNQNVINMH